MIVGAFKYIMRHEEEFAHWVMVFGRRGGRLGLVIGAIWLRWIGPAWCIKFWEGMGLGLIKSQSGRHGMTTTMNEDNELLGYNGSF